MEILHCIMQALVLMVLLQVVQVYLPRGKGDKSEKQKTTTMVQMQSVLLMPGRGRREDQNKWMMTMRWHRGSMNCAAYLAKTMLMFWCWNPIGNRG